MVRGILFIMMGALNMGVAGAMLLIVYAGDPTFFMVQNEIITQLRMEIILVLLFISGIMLIFASEKDRSK